MRSCSFGREHAANRRYKKCCVEEIRPASCSWLAVSRAWRRAGGKVAVPGRRVVQMLDPHLHEAATGSFRGNAVRAGRRRDRQRACSADPGCEAVVAAGWSLETTRPSDVQQMETRRRKKRIARVGGRAATERTRVQVPGPLGNAGRENASRRGDQRLAV